MNLVPYLVLLLGIVLLFGIDARADESMVLITDNNTTKIELTIDREILEPDTQIEFTSRFLDPTNNEQLEHVNYSFLITDHNGDIIAESRNIYTLNGVDEQYVVFSGTGSFTVEIHVHGIGVLTPFDKIHSGMATTGITVVPEFPLPIIMLAAVLAGMLILLNIRYIQKPQLPIAR